MQETISISIFKATCLRVLDNVKKTGKSIIVTRKGEPIALVTPPPPPPKSDPWLGCMKDRIKITGDIISPVLDEREWDIKMDTTRAEKLDSKQFLISPSQVEKLNRLARDEGASVAQMVRLTIDTYNPETAAIADLDASDLMELASERLKEAITSNQKANRAVSNTLKKLSTRSM